eukprot:7387920-Prymnesium_polylepis.3
MLKCLSADLKVKFETSCQQQLSCSSYLPLGGGTRAVALPPDWSSPSSSALRAGLALAPEPQCPTSAPSSSCVAAHARASLARARLPARSSRLSPARHIPAPCTARFLSTAAYAPPELAAPPPSVDAEPASTSEPSSTCAAAHARASLARARLPARSSLRQRCEAFCQRPSSHSRSHAPG